MTTRSNWGPSHPSWPHRASIWDREAIEIKRMIDESSHTIERGLQVFDDALREQNKRIDEDIALLLRAGIAMHRLTLANHDGETKRSLLVDGNPVQIYTIRYVMDGKPVCSCLGSPLSTECHAHDLPEPPAE